MNQPLAKAISYPSYHRNRQTPTCPLESRPNYHQRQNPSKRTGVFWTSCKKSFLNMRTKTRTTSPRPRWWFPHLELIWAPEGSCWPVRKRGDGGLARTRVAAPVVRVVLVVLDEEDGYMSSMREGHLSMGGFHGKGIIVRVWCEGVTDGLTGLRIFLGVLKSMVRVNSLMGMGITNRVVWFYSWQQDCL